MGKREDEGWKGRHGEGKGLGGDNGGDLVGWTIAMHVLRGSPGVTSAFTIKKVRSHMLVHKR